MKDIIFIDKLSFRYDNKYIFNNFSLNIKENSFVSIIGPNGSGKSTLAKLLVGLLKVSDEITISNLIMNEKNLYNIRKNIALVMDNSSDNFIAETVADEIVFGLENLGFSKIDIKERLDEIVKLLKIDNILDKDPYTLSGGEKKIISLASSLIMKPKIIIIDDAFEMIDKKTKEKIFKHLKKQKDLTVINITHNIEDVYYSDRTIILNQGEILVDGPTLKVLEQDKVFNRIGIELPFMLDLSLKLKLYGLVDRIILDMNEMVSELWK